jgi:hypothetical protein
MSLSNVGSVTTRTSSRLVNYKAQLNKLNFNKQTDLLWHLTRHTKILLQPY